MITEDLIRDIKRQFHINWSGIHGISHWSRVYDIGMKLTDHTGANRTVVKLFSIFHDSGRHYEGIDKQHGPRGADLATEFRKTHLRSLSDDEFDLLHTACCLHTSASSHENITIKTCFDADRLDLGRVGTVPHPKYLCTATAKSTKMISWALENSRTGKIPDNILGDLFSKASQLKN
jgi:uncharacterized protein